MCCARAALRVQQLSQCATRTSTFEGDPSAVCNSHLHLCNPSPLRLCLRNPTLFFFGGRFGSRASCVLPYKYRNIKRMAFKLIGLIRTYINGANHKSNGDRYKEYTLVGEQAECAQGTVAVPSQIDFHASIRVAASVTLDTSPGVDLVVYTARRRRRYAPTARRWGTCAPNR